MLEELCHPLDLGTRCLHVSESLAIEQTAPYSHTHCSDMISDTYHDAKENKCRMCAHVHCELCSLIRLSLCCLKMHVFILVRFYLLKLSLLTAKFCVFDSWFSG